MGMWMAACVAAGMTTAMTTAAIAQDAEPKEPAETPAAEPAQVEEPAATPSETPTPSTAPGRERPTLPDAPATPRGFEMSEEMKQRLREAGIDPDSIGGGSGGTGRGGAGMPGAGMPGAGMPGAGMPGAGFSGAGMPGAGAPGAGWGAPGAGAGAPDFQMPQIGSRPNAAPGTAPSAPAAAPAQPSLPMPPDEPPLAASEAKEVMLRMVGDWKIEVREHNGQPEPQSTTSGTSSYAMALGGRFVQETFKGEFGGRPVAGLGHTAFDTQRSYFTKSWLDSTSAAITTALGTWNSVSETITFAGLYGDGPGAVEVRVTLAFTEDGMLYTLMSPGAGGEMVKAYEISYVRAE